MSSSQELGSKTLKDLPFNHEPPKLAKLILSAVPSQAQDIIQGAAGTVFETLKNESMKDFDKKEIEDVLGSISGESFATLVNLSKTITDYGVENETTVDPDMERKDAEIDDEVGVAVLIDEEGFKIKEDSENEEDKAEAHEDTPREGDAGREELVIGGRLNNRGKGKAIADKDIIFPHFVDGFWAQRQLSDVYPDPIAAADKTSAMLFIWCTNLCGATLMRE
jgi:pre-mRNA-splicing helicase BRR2